MAFSVPDGFQVLEAQEFCRSVVDGTHDSPKETLNGKRLVTSKHIKQGRIDLDGAYLISEEDFNNINKRSRVDQWDVIFTMIGTVGEVALVKHQAPDFAIKNVGLFKSKSELRGRWLSYFLRSGDAVAELEHRKKGSTQQYVSLKDLRTFPVLFPSDEGLARDVVDTLSSLDDRVDLLRQTNATLEAIAQALFKSWFVDFDPVRAKAEAREPEGMDPATAALFPSEFEESELGLIPKGWSIRAVGDVATITRGRSYKSSELADSDTALVTLKSFNRGGGFRRDGFKPYTGPFKPEQEVFEGDCIVAHTDVTQQAELIGRSAVVTRSPLYSRLVASLDVGIVRPKTDQLTPTFLSALLSGDRYVGHIKGYTSGTTVLHLSKDGLPGFRFACPSPGLVKAYSELAFAMFQRQATNIAVQESLVELRDTLLPRLISGKLRLPEANEAVQETLATSGA